MSLQYSNHDSSFTVKFKEKDRWTVATNATLFAPFLDVSGSILDALREAICVSTKISGLTEQKRNGFQYRS
jgi:hypothetical protein